MAKVLDHAFSGRLAWLAMVECLLLRSRAATPNTGVTDGITQRRITRTTPNPTQFSFFRLQAILR